MLTLLDKIDLCKCDITQLEVDAVVNAANTRLCGGGGVDGAIHRAAGSQLLVYCQAIYQSQGGCRTGGAVITPAGNLNARYVIHTVGPIWQGGKNHETQQLASCYDSCFRLAQEYQITSLAFPNISTGVYGFPKKEAVGIALERVLLGLQNTSCLEKVVLVCFDLENYTLYQNALKVYR